MTVNFRTRRPGGVDNAYRVNSGVFKKSNVKSGNHENIQSANKYHNTSRFRVRFEQITGIAGGHNPYFMCFKIKFSKNSFSASLY